jgi:hypothetical protein
VVNPNAWYIAMHFDRLNEELILGTYGKQEKKLSKKLLKKIIMEQKKEINTSPSLSDESTKTESKSN